jgi:hypothetical protein
MLTDGEGPFAATGEQAQRAPSSSIADMDISILRIDMLLIAK